MEEELLRCGFCQHDFDAKERMPKFLPCRHQTLCQQCLNHIAAHTGSLSCASCKKTFDTHSRTLPDNTYIQYILKLKNKMENNASRIANQPGPNWCLTCDSVAHSSCAHSGHGLLNLTASTIKNVERLVSLKHEFKTMKDRLAQAIEKRKEIKIYFYELMEAVKSVLKDIEQQMDENDSELANWEAALEKNILAEEPLPLTAASLDVDEYFLSELVMFVSRSRPDGTLENLKKKVEETALDYTAKLDDITKKSKEIEKHMKLRISVRLSDPSRNERVVDNILCDGFITESIQQKMLDPIEKASLFLLSHIIYTLHKHGTGNRLSISERSTMVSKDSNSKEHEDM